MIGLLNLIIEIVDMFVSLVCIVYDTLYEKFTFAVPSFNIYLFSDTGWFSEPVPIISVLLLISAIFAFIFVIRLLWKATKKFINMIFGVFRL